MSRLIIFLLLYAIAAVAAGAAWRVKAQSRGDAIILGLVSAFFVIDSLALARLLPPMMTALLSLLLMPQYAFGALLIIFFFVTAIRGWPRAVYPVAGVAMLSPIIVLIGTAAVLFAGTPR